MTGIAFLKDGVLWALGSALLLVGQAAEQTSLNTGIGAIIQGGAFAVLAYAFLHFVIRTLPGHQQALERQQSAFMQALDTVSKRDSESDRDRERCMKELTEAINQLRVHCASKLVE